MAGKLKREEVKSVLEALSNVNRSLASCLQSLGESQKQLEKSVKCQAYLNHITAKSFLMDTGINMKRYLFSKLQKVNGVLPIYINGKRHHCLIEKTIGSKLSSFI